MSSISAFLNKFPEISAKQWKQQIQFLLNGEDYAKSIWQSFEEISINPFYNAETSVSIKHFHWENIPKIILKNKLFSEYEKDIHLPYSTFDPIGNLTQTGNFFVNKNEDFNKWKTLFEEQKVLYFDASIFAEAGATKIQQIAYGMSVICEYLNLLENIEKQDIKIIIYFAQHPDFYLEIAKIKAFRWVFKSIFKNLQNIDLQIITKSSKRYISLFQSEDISNKIKHFWALESGVFAGSDFVAVNPLFYENENENYTSWVRELEENISDKTLKNSFFVNNITFQMAQKSLSLWKDIQKGGGYLSQLKEHIIQRKIKEKAILSQKAFDSNFSLKNTILIDNYQNFISNKNPKKTLLEPILPKRLSEKWEVKFIAKK